MPTETSQNTLNEKLRDPMTAWSLLSLDQRKAILRSYFAEPYLSQIACEDAITVGWAIRDMSFIDRDYEKVGSYIRAELGA